MGDKATYRQKQAQALELRAAHKSYDEIAATCGWANRSSAYRAVAKALDEVKVENVEHLRTLELERLDRVARRLETLLEADDLGGGNTVYQLLAIMRQRARYLPGLEATPDEPLATGTGTFTVHLAMPAPERNEAVPEGELSALTSAGAPRPPRPPMPT